MDTTNWATALAPVELAGALADPCPTGGDERVSDDAVHEWATSATITTGELATIAGKPRLHPATLKVLLERAQQSDGFEIVVALLATGRLAALAPHVSAASNVGDDDRRVPGAAALLGCHFDDQGEALDMEDITAALVAASSQVADVIVRAYLAARRPTAPLIRAVDRHAARHAAVLDHALYALSWWDAPAARRITARPPAQDTFLEDRSRRPRRGRGQARPIPDTATWDALLNPAGASRIAWALVTGTDQHIPYSRLRDVVTLAREHSPDLMWALLTAQHPVHLWSLPEQELSDWVRTTPPPGWLGRRPGLSLPLALGRLLRHHGNRLDRAARDHLLERADLSTLAGWAGTEHTLVLEDVPTIRRVLQRRGEAVWAMVTQQGLLSTPWHASPVLWELVQTCPRAAAACLHPSEPEDEDVAHRLRRALSHRARAVLGDNAAAWAAFIALMDAPGVAATDELLHAALAITAPPARTG